MTWSSEMSADEQPILSALKMLELKDLHLSPEIFSLDMISGLPITSLDLSFNNFVSHHYEIGIHRGQRSTRLDNIYSIFCILTLKILQLRGMRTWGSWVAQRSNSTRAGTSSVTQLRLPYCVPAGEYLAELLTWPVALKSFFIESVPDLNSSHHRPYYGHATNQLSGDNFMETLYSQRHSIEALFMRLVSDYRDTDESTVGPLLRNFSALKSLGIDRVSLVFGDDSIAEVASDIRRNMDIRRKVYEMFPHTLEELLIEMEDYFTWYDDIAYGKLCTEGYDLKSCLESIAMYKRETGLPLKKISLWMLKERSWTRYWTENEKECYDGLEIAETDTKLWPELSESMDEAGISFECSSQYVVPPLFACSNK